MPDANEILMSNLPNCRAGAVDGVGQVLMAQISVHHCRALKDTWIML